MVEARIGEGGFGAVYRATQPLLGRLAALKVLHKRLATTAEATDRFLREARTASSLDHPYAAHIYSSGVERDGTLWIAMEHVRGTPFSEYLRAHGPLSVERFIPFLERVCEVVHSAHGEGIVHRDIKPANIMVLARAGRLLPKLLDFGIAKAIAATAGHPSAAPAADAADASPLSSLAETAPPASQEFAVTQGLEATIRGGASPSYQDAGEGRALVGGGSRDLTQRGQVIGSPHYMAPEQWDDAASVDARCDLYAIGVLAYEALTGELPFTGETISEVAEGHRRAQPPPVPEELPRNLDEVFARALAKNPDDRFQDALALGQAFRDASGLGADRAPLPRLPEPIRERFLADAPQPLSDAVATLDAAREPRQARDALWSVSDMLAHYLGLIAVCARSRFHGPGKAELPAALRRAGVEVLSAADWLEIAEALCAPHADRPELHPVPELVSFFTGGDSAAKGAAEFRELWRLREPLASAAAGDEALTGRLEEALSALSTLLQRAAFLCDYPLVLPLEGGGAETLMGLSRARRKAPQKALDVRGRGLRTGEPAILSGDGAPVLSLHPIVQMLAPAPDAPPELFFFAGGCGRGGKLVARPLSFERHDQEVLDWLRLQLETTFEAADSAARRERAPYRGLEAFTPDDASLFVGREHEVDAFLNRLQLEPLLAVVGPSGAGKSSFVQAGVIPAMRERVAPLRTLIFRPGAEPLAALGAQLASAGFATEELGTRLSDEPEHLGELLREDAAARGPILIVVDQFEELFTLTRSEALRFAFASALAGAGRLAEDPVRVVITLRDDFLVRAEALSPLQSRLGHALTLLTTPGAQELERIVVEPARRAGYEFEDPALPGRMVAEVQGEPGALALLSFTATLLWEARDRHFSRLPTRAYESLGGVGGALAHHAEALLDSMPHIERRTVRDAFRLLVTSEGTRAILGRGELIKALGDTPAAEAAVERLVTGRLLVVSEGEAGEQVEIAHEALLDAWPRLVSWRREDAEGARLRDQLRAAAVQWDRRGQPRGLLWRDDALAEYRLWRARYKGALTEVEDEFARASLAEHARGRRLRQSAVAAAFVALFTGLAVLFIMSQRADEARAVAEEQRAVAESHRAQLRQQLLDSYLEHGSQALLHQQYFHTIVYLAEAFEMGGDGPEEAFMLSMAAAPFEAQIATASHEGNVWHARFDPSGDTLLATTSAGSVTLRDGHDLSLLHDLRGHDDDVFRGVWHPDGARAATASFDGTVRLWNTETGESLRVLDHEGERVFSLSFDPTGEWLVTGSVAGRLRRFHLGAKDGEVFAPIDGHDGPIWQIAADPGGARVATGGEDGRVRLWTLESGAPAGELSRHDAAVTALRFDPAGARILSASGDGGARTSSARTGHTVAELRGHRERINGADIGPRGRLVSTASYDGTARIWDAETGRELALLEGHRGDVFSASFHPDGPEVLTAGADGTARRWNVETGALVAIVPVDVSRIGSTIYSPDGGRIVAVDGADRISLWSTELAERRVLTDHEALVGSVRHAPGGSRFVTSSFDKTAKVWADRGDDGPEVVATLPHDERLRVADLDRSEQFVATVDEAGAVTIWDLRERRVRQEIAGVDPARGDVRFSPDGMKVLVVGQDAGIYDSETGRRLVELSSGRAEITAARFSRDGKQVFSGDRDGRVWIFDADTGESLRSFDAHGDWIFALRPSPDETILATTSRDQTARLWDLETGEELAVLSGHDSWILDVDFSPDGALVATASLDGTVRISGVQSGRTLARLGGQRHGIRGVSFSPDGGYLASAHENATISLWPLPSQSWDAESVRSLRRCAPLELREGNPVPIADPPGDC